MALYRKIIHLLEFSYADEFSVRPYAKLGRIARMIQIGLSPEEMLAVYNRMFLDVWSRYKERIDWQKANISEQLIQGQEVDLSDWLTEVLEVMATASRDSAILTMAENNERIEAYLARAGFLGAETPLDGDYAEEAEE